VQHIFNDIQALPNGSRFYRCAFQVNTYEYVKRHNHETDFADEDTYNSALIDACLEQGIEVIGVTDHYRIKGAAKLIAAARTAGLIVFPGFEAVTQEGIHFLCLFDPDTPLDSVQARIGACGIGNEEEPSPLGELSAGQLLYKSPKWEMQCIAAHVAGTGGLFKALQAGSARIAIWRHEELGACSIAGPVEGAPQELRPILQNTNPDYQRARAIAVLNCQDVKGPKDLQDRGTWCWIKMTEPTIEGLRQAFLDPGSRVRIATDPEPEEHVEFVGISWETEGFLMKCRFHFNENMNVLIGGRGSGKSTVIESIRYVLGLEPITEDARKTHDGIVNGVLRSGTKVSLLVQSYRPDRRCFIIERTVPNPPHVIDETGSVLPITPLDAVGEVTIFGQNELAELSRSPEQLTDLLNRFVVRDKVWEGKYRATKGALEQSRRDILECEQEQDQVEEQLDVLPGLEETLARYKNAGVEAKLKSQDAIIRAEAVAQTASEQLDPFSELSKELADSVPLNVDFLSDAAIKGLPVENQLKSLIGTLERFGQAITDAQRSIAKAIESANSDISNVRAALETEKSATKEAYEQALRELQKEKIDGDEFIRLRREIERLKPLKDKRTKLETRMKTLQQKHRNDLATWEDLKNEDFQKLERAAKKVSRELPGQLRVKVTYAANRADLTALLKKMPGGRLAETISVLERTDQLSLTSLADACRRGAEALTKDFGIPRSQAERLADAGSELPLRIEELDLPHVTEIELNVGAENAPPEWRKLDDLSTGQKATALLYLLLLEADTPLILDQPEDNLDNRFISEGVVPKIRSEKRRRQFIFSTHNANIPVLGDAELIIGMRAVGEAGEGHAEVPPENMGSIDKKSVATAAEEILEGGKDAFMTRHRKYGF